jgi:hypothetical protein
MVGLGYLCIATVRVSIFWHSSRVAGRILRRNGDPGLKTMEAAYIVTRDNLASKSKKLDDMVIREQEANTLREQAKAKLADAEKRLTTAEGEKKDQGLLLEMAR